MVPKYNQQYPYKKETKEEMTVGAEGNVMTEARCLLCLGRSHKSRVIRVTELRAGKSREMDSPLEHLKEVCLWF